MVQVVTGDSQEKVMIFRDKQTLHHNIYIITITMLVQIRKIDTRTSYYEIPPQQILSTDSVTLTVDAVSPVVSGDGDDGCIKVP